MTINNNLNIFQGSISTTLSTSGLLSPFAKIYTSTMTASAQNLTTTSLEISGLSLMLPQQGIYEITANIREDLSGVTISSTSNNYSMFSLNNDNNIGSQISTLTSAITGINGETKNLNWIFNNLVTNNIIKIYGKINSVITGNWQIKSDTNGRSTMMARLIS